MVQMVQSWANKQVLNKFERNYFEAEDCFVTTVVTVVTILWSNTRETVSSLEKTM